MADKTKIEWTDATWTPIRARRRDNPQSVGWYCEHATPGCEHCYSEVMNRRLGTQIDFKRQNRDLVEIFLDEKMLTAPLRWRKPRKIFVCSMTDLFTEFVPDEWIDKLFAVMALCPQHTFQVLTKRAERMRDYMQNANVRHPGYREIATGLDARFAYRPNDRCVWPLPNVWLGVSVEDQARADERIPHLLATPAAVRFISAEPLLGPVDLTKIKAPCYVEEDHDTDWKFNALITGDCYEFRDDLGYWDSGEGPNREARLDWVIAGGESGPNARPMHPDWVRSLRDQCAAAGVPFFFKQWGEWREFDTGPQLRRLEFEDDETEAAETIAALGVHPCWLTIDGRRFDDFRIIPEETPARMLERVGKKAAGALLDGREHREFPHTQGARHG